MKRIILAACALAIVASATGANAEFGFRTAACSVADRGHPRVTFEVCAIEWSMAQGHAGFIVETPNGRRFEIHNYYRDLGPDTPTPPPLWFIDGRPAKKTDGEQTCYENRLVSICSTDIAAP
jgi:hypothetical protein